MQKPPLDPDVADTAPSDSVLTVYDEEHVITYLRLIGAKSHESQRKIPTIRKFARANSNWADRQPEH
jgi:hypothetical protein